MKNNHSIHLLLAVIFIFLISFERINAIEMTFEDIFHIQSQEAKKQFGDKSYNCLIKALTDFNAVLQGKKPIHAKFNYDSPLPADGGTCFYLGDGYSLTVYKSLNDIKRGKELVHGYIYGPSIYFLDEVIIGNMPTISFLTFYRDKDLERLLVKD